jgi:hypothetical protein
VVVATAVRNAPPIADAGRVTVAAAGATVRLDGALSSDANGDALSFAWDQTAGKPQTGPVAGAPLALRIDQPGLYAFELTAADAELAATQEVPVLVLAGAAAPTAVAASPVSGAAGVPVELDASATLSPSGRPVTFVWAQRDGPGVALDGAGTARPSFVPPQPGRYAFDVTALDGALRSPAARVEVFVAGEAAALPVAAPSAPPRARVGKPFQLDGSGSRSDGALAYAWRQVSGPAAGHTDADRPVATVVPFAAGSLLFELVVRDGPSVSVPAQVRVEADGRGVVTPVAVATAAPARAGELALLDGSASRGAAGKALRYRWTQVAGAWVALDATDPARPTFRPPVAGQYGFELEVDDGAVRGAPARVTVDVTGEVVR